MTARDQALLDRPKAVPAARRLKQWELLGRAAEGTWSEVYRARPADARNTSQGAYALKSLRPRWQDDPRAIALLQREAQVGRAVAHPHLVAVLSASVRQTPRFLVMPWLAGETLKARLRAKGPLAVHAALAVARQVLSALEALQHAGWNHGDVKPGNIFLSPEGHVTLLDLGFAHRAGDERGLTDHCLLGTCDYLAPELVCSRQGGDLRSDLYSLGVVLYESLCGRRPFTARDLAELAAQYRTSASPRLEKIAPHVPRAVADLVHRLLAKEPLRRPFPADDLRHELTGLEIDALAAWLR